MPRHGAVWELVDEAPLEPRALIAEKTYDSHELRAWLDDQELTPVIPRRGTDGQRPSEHADLYRERNKIERAFNRLKNFDALPPTTTSGPKTTSPPSN